MICRQVVLQPRSLHFISYTGDMTFASSTIRLAPAIDDVEIILTEESLLQQGFELAL